MNNKESGLREMRERECKFCKVNETHILSERMVKRAVSGRTVLYLSMNIFFVRSLTPSLYTISDAPLCLVLYIT